MNSLAFRLLHPLSVWMFCSAALHILVGGMIRQTTPERPKVSSPASALYGTTFDISVEQPARVVSAGPPTSLTPAPATPVAPRAPAPAPPETADLPSHRTGAPAASSVHSAPARSVSSAREVGAEPAAAPVPDSSPPASSRQPGTSDQPGSYGQAGPEGAPAQLRRAFIKTLPLAARLDAAWLALPTGELGKARFGLELDEHGQLSGVQVVRGPAHPALSRAMQKNRAFLGGRRFASSTGRVTLIVEVGARVTLVDSTEEAQDKVIALGVRLDPHDPQAEPTGAYFTYGSGRHIELTWRVVERP